jgi:hypothetical protein
MTKKWHTQATYIMANRWQHWPHLATLFHKSAVYSSKRTEVIPLRMHTKIEQRMLDARVKPIDIHLKMVVCTIKTQMFIWVTKSKDGEQNVDNLTTV